MMLLTTISVLVILAAVILVIRKKCTPLKNGKHFEIEFTIDNIKIKGKNMAVTAFPQQRIPFTLQPVDRKGNPAAVEAGTVEYWTDDEAVATVEEDPTNELAGAIITTGVGVTQLNYTADADLGEGVVAISGFDAIEVKPEAAVGFGITFGEPQDL
jgi:hypothetical protein